MINTLIKTLLTISLIATMIFPVNSHALSSIEKVANTLDLEICVEDRITLYNQNDEEVAYFYPGIYTGYLIVDADTLKPIEFSPENSLDFFDNTQRKYYYGGPLNYFYEQDGNIISKTGAVVEKQDLYFENKAKSFTVSNFEAINRTRSSNIRISHVPRNYSYNPNGICGSTAVAILLMYYDDYISDSYVASNYEVSGTGEALIKMLVPYIDGFTPGSTANDMVSGLNLYLVSRGLSRNAQLLSKANIATPFSSDKPVLIDLDNHPTYGEHWVVGYGYNRYQDGATTFKMYIVVNGWGNSGVYIDEDYCGRGVRI